MNSRAAIWIALSFLLFQVGAHAAEPTAADAEFFEKEVRPLLVERCLKCHGDDKPKSGLNLNSRANLLKGGNAGPSVVIGDPDASSMIQAIRHAGDLHMPPKEKLSEKQIAILTRWVKSGLPWPAASATIVHTDGRFTITEKQRQFWSFQPVRPVPLPAVRDLAWAQSPIDRFILAKLEANGLARAERADKRTLLRRATFDLIGLPPTPEEIDAFVNDDSPQAFAKVVDRLIAAPQYGERWGRHWLDVVRYADARDLIQLPPASDFREIWRYRDWVVDSFNRDLPYSDFIRHQVAGDLLPPSRKGGINKDGLIATGALALADFVPGDVDKEQMIADYVNDEIDLIGRALLGLSIACARCHDHKFDPISTDDYYALAGIFFSSRLVPGPVAGNTPLVRAPLLSPAEIAGIKAQDVADKKRRSEIESELRTRVDQNYPLALQRLVREQTAQYFVAAYELRKSGKPSSEAAKQRKLDEKILTRWTEYLARIEKRPSASHPQPLRDALAGKLAIDEIERLAEELQVSIAKQTDRTPTAKSTAILRLRADDPDMQLDSNGRVSAWPNRCDVVEDAKPPKSDFGPLKSSTTINGRAKPALRFDGRAILELPGGAPQHGSLFVVFQCSESASPGRRLVGWEDADVGKHGLGMMVDPGGRIHAVMRSQGQSGDINHSRATKAFEILCVTWGPGGTALFRDGVASGASKGINAISADPAITALRIGGPGSGSSPRFQGDIAEIRVYDRQLSENDRKAVDSELYRTWFEDVPAKAAPSDPIADLYQELLSSRGPFRVPGDERLKFLSPDVRRRLAELTQELNGLKNKKPVEIPAAVVVGEGGPIGTRHEGFKDSPIFIRGDHKRLGTIVPRGFPQILTVERREKITTGSGRKQLADWLARPESPLVARVMVNRIWQHHFGEGLVRTSNDFGERGERPTHPELLDDLAQRFIDSGWSVKSMHRQMMLSSAYQQSSRADRETIAKDPENRLMSRFPRRRLDAEAIRDSLLAVSGKLDYSPGGPAFVEVTKSRRTLYLLSARTGTTTDFGRLFDRADPGSIVGQRGQSIVAPQALFFLNDPFTNEIAIALAGRITRESWTTDLAKIKRVYSLALGRPPSADEVELGQRLLAMPGPPDSWVRYCHLVLCANEFLYVD